MTDALDAAGPRLSVVALGVIPLARVAADAALTKGELMRYLAELPLAPDAMAWNAALDWRVAGPGVLRVGATHGGVRGEVELTLGADGLVASIHAADRPRLEGRRSVERPWRGRFWDYRSVGGRRVPFAAEVAWVVDGQEIPVWRGRLDDWRLA